MYQPQPSGPAECLALAPAALSDSDEFVRLDAEPPPRMRETVRDRPLGVLGDIGPVHRLQKEVTEVEIGKILRKRVWLRVNELELAPALLHERRASFGTHADPVE